MTERASISPSISLSLKGTTSKPSSRAASKAPKTALTPATRSQPSRGATTPVAKSSGGKKRKAGEIALPPKTYQKTAAGKRTEILQEGEERAELVTSIILTDEYLLLQFKIPFELVSLFFSFFFWLDESKIPDIMRILDSERVSAGCR